MLKVFMASLGPALVATPAIRFETTPGEQMQVDWAVIRRGADRLSVFVATLGWSRAACVEFVIDERVETLIAAHENAFSASIPRLTTPSAAERGGRSGARWSRAGNPRLRTTMIQLAWLWLSHQPHSAVTRWFRGRVERNDGRLRKTMIVALARKLLVALWKYVSAGIVIEGAVMKVA